MAVVIQDKLDSLCDLAEEAVRNGKLDASLVSIIEQMRDLDAQHKLQCLVYWKPHNPQFCSSVEFAEDRLKYWRSWSEMHPGMAANPTFWDALLSCINQRKPALSGTQ